MLSFVHLHTCMYALYVHVYIIYMYMSLCEVLVYLGCRMNIYTMNASHAHVYVCVCVHTYIYIYIYLQFLKGYLYTLNQAELFHARFSRTKTVLQWLQETFSNDFVKMWLFKSPLCHFA